MVDPQLGLHELRGLHFVDLRLARNAVMALGYLIFSSLQELLKLTVLTSDLRLAFIPELFNL